MDVLIFHVHLVSGNLDRNRTRLDVPWEAVFFDQVAIWHNAIGRTGDGFFFQMP